MGYFRVQVNILKTRQEDVINIVNVARHLCTPPRKRTVLQLYKLTRGSRWRHGDSPWSQRGVTLLF
jgi:hypothetical protein